MIGKIYLTEGAAIGNKSTRFIETSTDWKSVKVGRKFHRQELETILIDLKDFRIKRARSIDEYSSGLMERNYLSRSRNCFETFFFLFHNIATWYIAFLENFWIASRWSCIQTFHFTHWNFQIRDMIITIMHFQYCKKLYTSKGKEF